MRHNQVTRVHYALSQAVSMAATNYSNLRAHGLTVSISTASAAGVLYGVRAYCFQGASIAEGGHDHSHCEHSQGTSHIETRPLLHAASEGHSAPSVSPGHTVIQMPNDLPNDKQYYKRLAAELGLNTTSVYCTVSSRYFLLTNLLIVFGVQFSAPTIWAIVLSDSAFKIMFDLTNELYETNEQLASAINQGVATKPVYAEWFVFRTISEYSCTRDFMAIVGTLEHSIVDDLLPWLLLVPENALTALAGAYKHFSVASKVAKAFTIMTPILGGLLVCSIIFQTMLFEAEHSYEAYANILDKKSEEIKSLFTRMPLSGAVLKFMRCTSYLMPACHGAASAAPVYVWMKQLMGFTTNSLFAKSSMTEILKSVGIVVTTLFTFLGTARGHYLSEFREAQGLITARLEEVVIQ